MRRNSLRHTILKIHKRVGGNARKKRLT